jgi:hypothetical protein
MNPTNARIQSVCDLAIIEQCESEATCGSIYLNNVSLDGDPFQCTNVHLIASNVSPKPC